MPKVTIILTSYNHAAYVAAAIESALNQTFTDFELFIVDDGSSDNSREIIKTFDDPRIKIFLYEVNRGPVIAIREAFKAARGKYIAVHHSDDLWTPDKLEKQVAYLDANPNCAACFTWADFVDERGESMELDDKDFYKKIFEQPNRTQAEWLNYFFYNANCLCHPSAVLKREAYKNFRLLDVNGFWQLPDLLMWIRLSFNAQLFILPERLTKFRLRRARQENTSATTFDKLVRADLEFFLIAQEFVDSFTDDKFFLQVFPNAERFLVDGQINRRFALAQICLERKDNSAFNLAGLSLLKNLLSSPQDAAQIKKLYDYDDKTFLRDGGSYDVFNLQYKLAMLRTEIYAGDYNDFDKFAEKIISVDSSRKFYLRTDFELPYPVKYLRFDPDTNFVSVKIDRVLINGAAYEIADSNAHETYGGFLRFLTNDPQIIFRVDDLSGHVTFEIFGEQEKNYNAIISKKISNLVTENAQLVTRNEKLQEANDRLNRQIFGDDSIEHHSSKDRLLSAARTIYKALPFDDDKKTALKDKFYTTFAPLLKGTHRYKIWHSAKIWQNATKELEDFLKDDEKIFSGECSSQPGKIAIQAHIFYLDLLDDMADYCAKMPYKFDALISVVDAGAVEKVRAAFEKIPTVEKCVVRVVPNRGRDVAPFFVGFGDLLPQYDFVSHIHSKKSLYTGSDQKIWRDYLFDALLGSPERIRKIFAAFVADEQVGVIYPRPSENVPYPSFTWMTNRAVGYDLLKRAGIAPNVTEYFDFPAGTMFWARSRTLRKFFALNLTIDDFPPEQGQNDGTLAHALERSILLAAKSEGMNYYEFAPDKDTYTVNHGNKNIWQYLGSRNFSDVEFEWLLEQDDIISFAVFDTLLMNYLAAPEHINEIVGIKVEDLLGHEFNFPTLRAEAERLARQKKGSDVTLDEIYKSFLELTDLDRVTCKKIRELEFSTVIKLSLPRKDVVEWFREIVSRGREVWIITDTCLTTHDLKQLLGKFGIDGYDKVIASCELGLRKDTAELWNDLAAQGYAGRIIHIGANEMSDAQLPGDRNFGIYHLMSATNLFSQVPFGRALLEKIGGNMSLYASICLGVMLAKNFQSPFQLRGAITNNTHRLILKTFNELGRWLYGVPLLTFALQQIKLADSVQKVSSPAASENFLSTLCQFVAKMLNVTAPAVDTSKISVAEEYRPLFKAILVAPDDKSEHLDKIREVHEGIKDFCRDVVKIFGDVLLRVPADEIFVDAWLAAFHDDKKILVPELQRVMRLVG